MDELRTILATVLPVFAIMGAGYAYARFKPMPTQALANLLFWIFIPCLVLGSLGSAGLELAELLQIGAGAAVVVLGGGVVAFLLFLRRPERRALLLPCMFMNSANMALPLAFLAFGEAGLGRQVVFYVAVHILNITLGVGIARGKGGFQEVFRLPLVYAASLAVFLALMGIQIPGEVAKPLNLVGKTTIPLMLLVLGARLGKAEQKHLWPAVLASVVRIGGGFCLGLLVVWMFGLTGLARAAVLLGAVMPAAIFNFVLAERYRLHPELMATTVVISTLISVVTTPLFLSYIID